MNDALKKIDLKEFSDFGYLQEVNRMFLHPLGLSLGVEVDEETGEATFGGIVDGRDDPIGVSFIEDELDIDKYHRVWGEQKDRGPERIKNFGYWLQRVPGAVGFRKEKP